MKPRSAERVAMLRTSVSAVEPNCRDKFVKDKLNE